MSHSMPTDKGECLRVCTGFEKMIAHRCTDIYAYTAKQDGVVVDTDDNLKLMKLQYTDGSVHVLSYAPQYGECSDMFTEQQQMITVKRGDKFKKHDVLRYNPQFFELDQDLSRQVNYKHGVTANVAIVENSTTFEDSNPITEKLSKALEIHPVETRIFTLPPESVIHEAKYVGDQVEMNDPLMIFELEDLQDLSGVTTDEFALQYLDKLNRSSPKAKIKGTVVDVRIFYACELDDMHLSLSNMIRKQLKRKQSITKYVKDANNKYTFSGSSQVPVGSKYKGIAIDKNTVIIQYLIKQDLTSHAGDKVVIDSSLKSVTCTVMEHPAVTIGGKEIDIFFSASSISNRIVNSPLLVGIAENVLETLEEKCIKLYFK